MTQKEIPYSGEPVGIILLQLVLDPGKATILTGTGKYKGISGSGTMTWKQSVPNVTDPMRWGHSYQASLKFSMP